MKKLIAVAVLAMATVAGWAQGTVDFRNSGVSFPVVADRLVYADRVGGTKLIQPEDGSSQWVAALFYVKGSQGDEHDMVQAGSAATMRGPVTTSPGAWSNAGLPDGNNRVLQGVVGGETATLQVRVWDAKAFGSWAEAVAGGGMWGASAHWDYTVPTGTAPPSDYYLNGLRAFALVPEPSVIALGVLGAAGLLLFRRRK